MDFLATKGIEYLLVIAYLLLFIPFWRLVFGEGTAAQSKLVAAWKLAPVQAMRTWFRLPADRHYHQGHTWAIPEGNGIFRVGLDDFAQRLLGRPKGVELPATGAAVEQGARGFGLQVDGQTVGLLSPVAGEVTETNPAVLRNPGLLNDDPYGGGWLMKVKSKRPRAVLDNLLSGELARQWMDEAAEGLSRRMGPTLGPVLQDGGVPIAGFVRELAPSDWLSVAKELLKVS